MYATRSDLLRVLADAEAQCELQYVRVGDQDAAEPTVSHRAADIPDLGVAKDGWVLREDRWYVFDRSTHVVVDEVQRPGRSSRYFVGTRLNPDAVLIVPGGRLGERGIVQGTINPVSPSERALSVFKCLKKVFQRTFTDAGGVLVGPEALLLYRSGMRLASSLHSPPESDFKMETE
jgi:hypothetical protein